MNNEETNESGYILDTASEVNTFSPIKHRNFRHAGYNKPSTRFNASEVLQSMIKNK